jgi:predicted DNA-binding transcriptional regulator AlpA
MSGIEKGYTIPEWCAKYRMSRAFYYVLKAQGKGPRELRLGVKVLITPKADAEWLQAREAEQATA